MWYPRRMNRADIVSRLDSDRETRFGVTSLRLFGSFAKDAARPDSDIDLLVQFSAPATMRNFMDLKFHLEDLFGRNVDLVLEGTVRHELQPAIAREAVRVA